MMYQLTDTPVRCHCSLHFVSVTNSILQLIIKMKHWLCSTDLLNPHGMNLGAHRIWGWVGLTASLDILEVTKVTFIPDGNRNPDCPAQ